MEAVVLVMVCLSPWAFGAVHPYFELWLYRGVAALLILWGLRILLEGRLTWNRCPVALCLVGLFLTTVAQFVTLPSWLLGAVSPATASMVQQFLPDRPETLPDGTPRAIVPLAAGSSISFCPSATRTEAFHLLALFLVFAVVRNNTASVGALRRLSIAALSNGALLAIFALCQFFSSPALLYWSFSFQGKAFGPFLCRNHFPFYINLCVGLGVGLLLSIQATEHRHRERNIGDRSSPGHAAALLAWLQSPGILWTVGALAMMLSSVAVSLSRGGMLSVLAGAAVCLSIRLAGSRRWLRLETAMLVLASVLGLLCWFGIGRIQARLETLWTGQAFQEGRLPLWTRVFPLITQYPLLGTGQGTFQFVEPLSRPPGESPAFYWEHAHNDYLEVWVEGGLVQLMLSLLTIALVFHLGIRAYRCRRGQPAAGLALGALFALTTVVVHSFGDFGLHIPAVTLLAAVVAAQLCALGKDEAGDRLLDRREQRDLGHPAFTLRLHGLAPVAAAAVLVGLGFILVREGARAEHAERFRLTAARCSTTPGSADSQRRIALLEAAVHIARDDAGLQAELAEAHYQAFRSAQHHTVAQAAQAVLAVAAAKLSAVTGGGPVILFGPACSEVDGGQEETQASIDAHLLSSLQHALAARDLCPLMARPHLQIARNVGALASADPRASYVARAKRLSPSDPEIWYIAGLEELAAGQPEEAWRSWHRSLECSNRYLAEIVTRSAQHLTPRELAAHLLPQDPRLLYNAAVQLNPDATALQEALLQQALRLLDQEPAPLRPADLHLKALIYRSLDQPAQALASYRAALTGEPRQLEWRYEYAELLHVERQMRPARDELMRILAQSPGHPQARTLLNLVNRQIRDNP
jgi:O-antigen ligase